MDPHPRRNHLEQRRGHPAERGADMTPQKRPAEQLRAIAAPRELIEWVRKMNPEEATRRAWIDVTRADWLPYLAVLRGISHDAIVRAACECTVELAGPALAGAEGARIVD